MAKMAERRILVLEGNGLNSNVDRLSWKVKAIVAQEEREKVARRVRDNLRYLRRNGQLLGTIPQGYRRVDGSVVEDPVAAPTIKEIFQLYATGRFSLRTLADHLNRNGIRPARGDGKANHNRPKAIIFTGDVLKDLIGNPSYAGKVLIDVHAVAICGTDRSAIAGQGHVTLPRVLVLTPSKAPISGPYRAAQEGDAPIETEQARPSAITRAARRAVSVHASRGDAAGPRLPCQLSDCI